jgi:soluble lytic murein transglycosylase
MKTPVPVVAELPVFLNDPRRSPPPGDFQDVNLADEFQFIVSLGDDELAQTMLEAYPKESTPVDWLTASGNFEPAIQKLTEVRKKEKRLPYGFRELYFPRRYWAEFQESAKRFGLDPYLMLSIARQESIFRSRAISAAKAMGVIQLLPQTARQLHRELPETSPFRGRKFYPERLYEPAWAIELGTFFMARLYRKYGRNWIRAVGAYNAGPIPMDNWIRTRDHEDPLLFIEMIPYAETKTYIQLIFRNMLHYRRADGQDANTYITSILAAQ